jgi:hypothetical protein
MKNSMSCHGFLRPSAAVELSNPSTGPVSICGLVPRNDSWKEPIGPPLEMPVVLLSGSLLGSRSLFCTRREEERSERNEHVESVNESERISAAITSSEKRMELADWSTNEHEEYGE